MTAVCLYIKSSRVDVVRHSARKVFVVYSNYYYAKMLFFLIGGIDPIFYYLSECLVLFSDAKLYRKYYTAKIMLLQCCVNLVRG